MDDKINIVLIILGIVIITKIIDAISLYKKRKQLDKELLSRKKKYEWKQTGIWDDKPHK